MGKNLSKPSADISFKVWVAAVLCIVLGLFESGITLFNNTIMGDLEIIPDVILTVLWCYVCNSLFKKRIMGKVLSMMIIFSSFLYVVGDLMFFDEYLEDIGFIVTLIALILWLISRIIMMCKYSGLMKKYASFDLFLGLALFTLQLYMELSGLEFGYAYGDGRWMTYLAIVLIIIPYNYMYNMLIEGNEEATFIQII